MQLFKIKHQLEERLPGITSLVALRELLEFALYETKHEAVKKKNKKTDSRLWFISLNLPKRMKILKKAYKEYLKEERERE